MEQCLFMENDYLCIKACYYIEVLSSVLRMCVLYIAMRIHNLQVASVCTQSLEHNEACKNKDLILYEGVHGAQLLTLHNSHYFQLVRTKVCRRLSRGVRRRLDINWCVVVVYRIARTPAKLLYATVIGPLYFAARQSSVTN